MTVAFKRAANLSTRSATMDAPGSAAEEALLHLLLLRHGPEVLAHRGLRDPWPQRGRLASEVVFQVGLDPRSPVRRRNSRQSVPELEVFGAGLVRRAEACDLRLEQRVHQLAGVKARRRVEEVSALRHHETPDQLRGVSCERGADVAAARVS